VTLNAHIGRRVYRAGTCAVEISLDGGHREVVSYAVSGPTDT